MTQIAVGHTVRWTSPTTGSTYEGTVVHVDFSKWSRRWLVSFCDTCGYFRAVGADECEVVGADGCDAVAVPVTAEDIARCIRRGLAAIACAAMLTEAKRRTSLAADRHHKQHMNSAVRLFGAFMETYVDDTYSEGDESVRLSRMYAALSAGLHARIGTYSRSAPKLTDQILREAAEEATK